MASFILIFLGHIKAKVIQKQLIHDKQEGHDGPEVAHL
jgi:hypothetical protein